ncbi:F-box protein [Phanerochaete sordida]|uniref:F-box protein n=1 Tax=Phanerochaete sordida TaxID=48140 RepID=A0A9P3LDK4_9APHY|nr:F-box protein [Phanerochaete sordida]
MPVPPEWPLSFNTEEAVDAAVEKQKLAIQTVQQRIYALLSRRNELSPTGRLPVEVLGMIFHALVQAWVQHHYNEDDLSPRSGSLTGGRWDWLSATHVCRHWRQVSLQTPQLWTYIPLKAKNAASYFQMSGRLPLVVLDRASSYAYGSTSYYSEESIEMLVQNMRRVRNLCVPLDTKFVKQWALHRSLDAPFLEHVSVRFHTSSSIADIIELLVPNIVRQASWPRLRIFSALGSPSNLLAAAMQPALTFLKVSLPLARLSPEVWIELLRNTPLLERLYLVGAVNAPLPDGLPAPSTSTNSIVTLPLLRHLSLAEDDGYIGLGPLIRCIVTSPTAQITFYERAAPSLQADFEGLATNARGGPYGLGVPRRAVQAMDVNYQAGQHLIFLYAGDTTLAFDTITEPLRSPEEDADTTITLGRHREGVIARICLHYPLDEVRSVRFSGEVPMDARDWHALGRLPSLKAIEIADGHMSAALCYLYKAIRRRNAFPALDTLILNDIHWHTEAPYLYGVHVEPEPAEVRADEVLEMLGDALATRRKHATPLKKLAILSARKRRGEHWDADHDGNLEDLRRHVEEMFRSFNDDAYESEADCSTCHFSGTVSESDSSESATSAFWS